MFLVKLTTVHFGGERKIKLRIWVKVQGKDDEVSFKDFATAISRL